MDTVVVGGSAVTAYAPAVYTSEDIDFAVLSGVQGKKLAKSLAKIGFKKEGRSYIHSQVRYTLDFVADEPYIDRRVIEAFSHVVTLFSEHLRYIASRMRSRAKPQSMKRS